MSFHLFLKIGNNHRLLQLSCKVLQGAWLFALLFFVGSCTTVTWVNTGGYWLESVDTPDSVSHPNLSESGIYSDDDLGVTLEMEEDGFSLRLLNRSGRDVKVHWDRSTYTDEMGTVHPLMHNNVESYTKGQVQMPTVIRSGGTLEDFVAPSDAIVSDEENGLSLSPLWRIHSYKKKKEAKAARPDESAVLISLALEQKGVTSDYIFRFAGDDYQTERIDEVDYGKTITAWNVSVDAIIIASLIYALFF